MPEGPNVRKLIVQKLSVDAIPKDGSFEDGIKLLLDRDRLAKSMKSASAWVAEAIKVVRLAAEPNPWKNADDEAIAAEILQSLEAKKKQGR